MKIQAVVLAAGRGKRFHSRKPKALVSVEGQPLVVYALKVFEKCSLIDSIILVVPQRYKRDFEILPKRFGLRKICKIVYGGISRRQSAFNGLKALDHDTTYVAIHDAARPFVSLRELKAAIGAAKKGQAAVLAVPVTSTIKTAGKNGFVQETLERKWLWEVQTPQVFRKDLILKAHRKIKMHEPTDDAVLVEKLGHKVKIVKGSYANIKITTPEDLARAKLL